MAKAFPACRADIEKILFYLSLEWLEIPVLHTHSASPYSEWANQPSFHLTPQNRAKNLPGNSLLPRQLPRASCFRSTQQPMCAKAQGNQDFCSNWKCSNRNLKGSCLATGLGRAGGFQLNTPPHLEAPFLPDPHLEGPLLPQLHSEASLLPQPHFEAPLAVLCCLPSTSSGPARNLPLFAQQQWNQTCSWGLQTWTQIRTACTGTPGQSVWGKPCPSLPAEVVRSSAGPAAQPSPLLAGQESQHSEYGNSVDSSSS